MIAGESFVFYDQNAGLNHKDSLMIRKMIEPFFKMIQFSG